MARPGPTLPHYLRATTQVRMPRHWAYFDTEAWRRSTPRGEAQTWKLGVSCHDDERHRERGVINTTWATHLDAPELSLWWDGIAEKRYRTVVIAHNLAYDLRIGDVFAQLPRLGWQLQRAKLDSASAWVSWRNGDRALTMIDLFSWLPTSLQRIGAMVELEQVPKPTDDDDLEGWLARCRRDVEILRAAWRRILDFIVVEELGAWQATGAGMAFQAWRHRFLKHKILVGLDDGMRAAEREAAWTGRCEVWRHGEQAGGPFTEWDFYSAYAQIGREANLPTKPLGTVTNWTVDDALARTPRLAVLARVTVETAEPLVPTRVDGRILWPVGRFETVLWDPELRLLVERGAKVDVHEVTVYQTGPILQEFMEWCLTYRLVHQNEGDTIESTLVHQWSRAIVGRLGMRYRAWEPWGEAPEDNCVILPGVDLATGDPYSLLWVGREVFRQTELTEYPDGTPAVMAWVMSSMRVKLWRTMEVAGPGNVLYVDTDSVITNPAGDKRLSNAIGRGELGGLRRKHVYQQVELWAPRQLVTDRSLRAAGVSKKSVEQADGSWLAPTWRSLSSAMKRGQGGTVEITDRRVMLHRTDRRRVHLVGGATAAIRLGDGAS